MILASIKNLGSFFLSFFKPVVVRKNVMVNGEDSEGIVIPNTIRDPNKHLAKYTPYQLDYILIGVDHVPGKEYVFYRFYDPETKKEFHLSKPLVDLLLYKKTI